MEINIIMCDPEMPKPDCKPEDATQKKYYANYEDPDEKSEYDQEIPQLHTAD